MLDKYFETSFTLDQLRNGPAGVGGGICPVSRQGRLFLVDRSDISSIGPPYGHFLQLADTAFGAVQPETIVAFERHLTHCKCPKPRGGQSVATVRCAKCFLRYLWNAGVVNRPVKQPWPPLVQGFGDWLQFHRGASKTTVSRYSAAAAELLEALGSDCQNYDAERLRTFIVGRAERRGIGGTKAILSAVRMFLRYLASQQKCPAGLDAAIPAIAGWRLAALPYALSVDDVEKLLRACDIASVMGLRDRAVILLLARLGLRASDVSALCFADIDWGDASILVKGKSRREARLPLPQEVGDAILAYLEVRPCVDDGRVFLRCVAPLRGLPGSSVSQMVRRNMQRAGLTAPAYGSHVLRHTAATEMLRSGVSLYDIGSVLRHRSADMSAYYAKVDMALLEQVAQPWPEVLSC